MIVTVSPFEIYGLLILVVVLGAGFLRYWLRDHASHAKNVRPTVWPFMQPVQPAASGPVGITTQLIAPNMPIMTGTMPVMADMNYQIVNLRFAHTSPAAPAPIAPAPKGKIKFNNVNP